MIYMAIGNLSQYRANVKAGRSVRYKNPVTITKSSKSSSSSKRTVQEVLDKNFGQSVDTSIKPQAGEKMAILNTSKIKWYDIVFPMAGTVKAVSNLRNYFSSSSRVSRAQQSADTQQAIADAKQSQQEAKDQQDLVYQSWYEKLGIGYSDTEKQIQDANKNILGQRLQIEQLSQDLQNKLAYIQSQQELNEVMQQANELGVSIPNGINPFDTGVSTTSNSNTSLLVKYGVPIAIGIGLVLLLRKR